jgi:hypothetical protein
MRWRFALPDRIGIKTGSIEARNRCAVFVYDAALIVNLHPNRC